MEKFSRRLLRALGSRGKVSNIGSVGEGVLLLEACKGLQRRPRWQIRQPTDSAEAASGR